MHVYLLALGIFALRICDVSIGTIRVIYTIRGKRLVSAGLGVLESGIWIFAISKLFASVTEPITMIGWALGFGAGTVVGITLERWIASGHILMRVISPESADNLRLKLLELGVGVTAVPGEGRDGKVQFLFVVAQRRRGDELLKVVQSIDANAFITIDPISHAVGGYMPMHVEASAIRK
jgi:uncharacterized protein YebE (UPF0316 family)